jgi:hypothetical protein
MISSAALASRLRRVTWPECLPGFDAEEPLPGNRLSECTIDFLAF